MRVIFRRATVLMFLLAFLHAPAAFAQYDNCFSCRLTIHENGTQTAYCRTPDPLVIGREYCEITEIDTNWWVCQVWGNQCCNDPW